MKIGQTGATPAINPVGSAASGQAESASAAKGGKTTAGQAASSTSSAKVELSHTAKALLDGADGGFDQAKVDRVRQSISDGTYKINPEAIADKLIANAQELLGRVSPSSG